MKKKNNLVTIMMGAFIVILMILLCILLNNKEKSFYDISKLKVKVDENTKIFEKIDNYQNEVEQIRNGEYSASLLLNGDILVKNATTSNLLNIHKIIDIVEFDVPSDISEQLMYMLDESGNVYSYKFGNINNSNYDVEKIDTVKNVKKLFISRYNKENAGGSWALFAITTDNECVIINTESV